MIFARISARTAKRTRNITLNGLGVLTALVTLFPIFWMVSTAFPEAAVLAVAAGSDLLCLGRDQDRLSDLAVRDALVAAATYGAARTSGQAAAEVLGLA